MISLFHIIVILFTIIYWCPSFHYSGPIIVDRFEQINISFEPNASIAIPFYQIQSDHLTRITRTIPYWILNYSLLDQTEFFEWVRLRCFLTRSIVYVGIYHNVFTSNSPRTKQFGFSVLPPYKQFEVNKRNVIGKYDIGVYCYEEFHEWGHMIVDFICSFFYLPEEVHKQGFIIHGP